jgi:hypothetical protein
MQEQILAKLLSGSWRATRADLQSVNENITAEIKSGPCTHLAAAAEIVDRKLETGCRFAGRHKIWRHARNRATRKLSQERGQRELKILDARAL